MDGQVNASGTLLMVIILSMIVTSLPIIRRIVFELFYYLHIAFALTMIACAFYHSGMFVVILAICFWGSDLIIRKIIMTCRYPRKATLKRFTDTVVEIRIPKTKHFDYNSGQYMFIAIPELSIFQWHPISISSSPYMQHVTFHIRKRGNWTSALYDLAGKKDEITLLLEGPYGSSGVDLTSNRYKMALLFSGGIGVTPMQSICHQMMHEHESNKRSLTKLWFIWTTRDPEVMENMGVVRGQSDTMVSGTEHITNKPMLIYGERDSSESSVSCLGVDAIPQRMLLDMPISHTPDDELELELSLDDFLQDEDEDDDEIDDEDEDPKLDIEDQQGRSECKNSIQGDTTKESICDTEIDNTHLTEVLSLDLYLTAKEMKEAGISSLPFVKQGRPDMKKIFLTIREEAIKEGEKRVAICVSAPKRLVQICRMACTKYSNKKVRFDFHSEVFQ